MEVSDILVALGAYGLCIAVYAFLNWREFRRCPEKGARYRVLPVRYKLMCWFAVLPLFAGTFVPPVTCQGGWKALAGLFFPAALISFALVEAACVSWYRKQGLL